MAVASIVAAEVVDLKTWNPFIISFSECVCPLYGNIENLPEADEIFEVSNAVQILTYT